MNISRNLINHWANLFESDERTRKGDVSYLNEGAGAGYTVKIEDLKLGKVKSVEETSDEGGNSFYEFTAEIVPGEYKVSASDYYNQYCEDEPVRIDGGTIKGWIDASGDDYENEVRRAVENQEIDLSFDYGWGWVHVYLPEDGKIHAEKVDLEDGLYYSVVDMQLDSKELAQAVNDGYRRSGEEDGEVDESTVAESGEKKSEWFNDGLYELAKPLPAECIIACSGSGKKDDEVAYWVGELGFDENFPRERAIKYLKEFGAWSEDELKAKTDTELAQIVLWVFCGNLYDEAVEKSREDDKWGDRGDPRKDWSDDDWTEFQEEVTCCSLDESVEKSDEEDIGDGKVTEAGMSPAEIMRQWRQKKAAQDAADAEKKKKDDEAKAGRKIVQITITDVTDDGEIKYTIRRADGSTSEETERSPDDESVENMRKDLRRMRPGKVFDDMDIYVALLRRGYSMNPGGGDIRWFYDFRLDPGKRPGADNPARRGSLDKDWVFDTSTWMPGFTA